MVERHIVFGDSFALNKDQYFSLKEAIASHFSVELPHVVMVGSAKLGFSIAPTKIYKPFDDTSDIDMALVSSDLFDRIWIEVFEHRRKIGYWPDERSFNDYLARGWIRPDKLPASKSFPTAGDWWEFFRTLTTSLRFGPYAIRAGIYKDWPFLRAYHEASIEKCRSVGD